MNGRLYDPALHRFLMPDNYVQDTYNTQNFNRYAYVLNNPLRYTDPSGELTQEQWDQAVDMATNLLNSPGGGGGHIGGDMTAPVYFSSMDVAMGYGMGYMDTFNGWGSQPGWAGSPQEALNRYNGGTITEGMVEGYYTQQWAGTGRENISASYSAKGGFNVSYNFNPGVGNGTGVGNVFVSDGKMAGLMGGDKSRNGLPGWLNNEWSEAAIDQAGNYASAAGIEASIVEGASIYGVNAAAEIGTKALRVVSRTSTAIGWGGVIVSSVQAYQDFRKGNTQAGLLHSADATVNGILLTTTAIFPAAAPFTLVIGLAYNIWAATRE